MKKIAVFPFSLDLIISSAEYISRDELDRSKPYEDEIQNKEDNLNLAQHKGEFVLVDKSTGKIEFMARNYEIDKKAIKDFFKEIATPAVLQT